LLREPIDVLGDIRRRVLDVATAKRVYGVIVADDEVVDSATSACRLDRRRQRLDGVEPEDLRQPQRSDGTVGDLLHVVNGRWWCNGADLGPVQTTYKDAAPMRECRVRDIAAEFDAADHEMADRMVFREWFCPVTGYRIDTEICRAGEPSLADILLHT
jgi:N-methylhydantoinase B